MILIDGSHGEGGGQILRTALSLSAVTGKAVEITNIRSGRPNPGLRPQHLIVVNALSALCDARVSGAAEGSRKITFLPGEMRGGNYHFRVGTAGSVTLVLSALMPALMNAPKPVNVVVSGGTDVAWSPPVDYLSRVTIPILARFGFKGKLNVLKRGYYPAGGGSVELRAKPSKLKPVEIVERGKIIRYGGVSHAHDKLARTKVAQRQAKSAHRALSGQLGVESKIDKEYCQTESLGSGVVLWAECENTVLGGSCLGEKTLNSETVGGEAGLELVEAIHDDGALDKFMADQIIPYLALAGGRVSACEITSHTRTNAEVARLFGYDIEIKDKVIMAESE